MLGGAEWLDRLKAAPRKPGEASLFFWDAHFRNAAVKVLPGEYFVHDEDLLITTTLGSCIAACLWDRERRIGGMNHFMLPEGSGQDSETESFSIMPARHPETRPLVVANARHSPGYGCALRLDRARFGAALGHARKPLSLSAHTGGRYGSYAMELLINELMKRGATRSTLEAKVFGGGAVTAGMNSINVGERNTRFVIDYLQTEGIPIVSRDVMEIYPRKVCFLPASGKAMVKRLAPTHADAFVAQDSMATLTALTTLKALPTASGGGAVDPF